MPSDAARRCEPSARPRGLLEPCAGKLARTVLRGPRRGNTPGLPDNTAVDHVTVLDAALAQIPDQYRHGTPILVRADTAGCTREFLTHIRRLREQAMSCEFS